MTLFLNILALTFFLGLLAFGLGLCTIMLREHGARMLAAFAGQPFAPATPLSADGRLSGAQKSSRTSVNLHANPPKIEGTTAWAYAA